FDIRLSHRGHPSFALLGPVGSRRRNPAKSGDGRRDRLRIPSKTCLLLVTGNDPNLFPCRTNPFLNRRKLKKGLHVGFYLGGHADGVVVKTEGDGGEHGVHVAELTEEKGAFLLKRTSRLFPNLLNAQDIL